MLLLFETSAGYALFKVLQPGKLSDVSNMWETYFKTPEKLDFLYYAKYI
jgi:hypothetical protein